MITGTFSLELQRTVQWDRRLRLLPRICMQLEYDVVALVRGREDGRRRKRNKVKEINIVGDGIIARTGGKQDGGSGKIKDQRKRPPAAAGAASIAESARTRHV